MSSQKDEFYSECLSALGVVKNDTGYMVNGKAFNASWDDFTCRQVAEEIAHYGNKYFNTGISAADVIKYLQE